MEAKKHFCDSFVKSFNNNEGYNVYHKQRNSLKGIFVLIINNFYRATNPEIAKSPHSFMLKCTADFVTACIEKTEFIHILVKLYLWEGFQFQHNTLGAAI